ncbi:hypothetical protein D3C85_1674920 [compost metagenome]
MGKTQGVKASRTPKPKKAANTQAAPPFSASRPTKLSSLAFAGRTAEAVAAADVTELAVGETTEASGATAIRAAGAVSASTSGVSI